MQFIADTLSQSPLTPAHISAPFNLQVLMEDRQTNRLSESLNIFETIVNNRVFSNVSIILFLNKTDLLEEKVKQVSIKDYFPEFSGDSTSVADVQRFLAECFRKRRREQQQKPLYHHFTTAINTENIRLVFRDVKDTILHDNLKQLMLQWGGWPGGRERGGGGGGWMDGWMDGGWWKVVSRCLSPYATITTTTSPCGDRVASLHPCVLPPTLTFFSPWNFDCVLKPPLLPPLTAVLALCLTELVHSDVCQPPLAQSSSHPPSLEPTVNVNPPCPLGAVDLPNISNVISSLCVALIHIYAVFFSLLLSPLLPGRERGRGLFWIAVTE